MGMLDLDEDEPEFNLMAMSDAKSYEVADELILCQPKNSSITLTHVQCVADSPQENEDDAASFIDDLNDYLNLVKSHEALQSLVSRYMSDNVKLTQELKSLKGKYSEAALKHNDYAALQASHKYLEHKFSENRLENEKLANQNAKNIDELSALRSEVNVLQKRLETAQVGEQHLQFKLKSLYDASQATKTIEQSLLPHGSKEGLGYVAVSHQASTSTGIKFIPATISIPEKPTVVSVCTGKGKEKEVSSDPPKITLKPKGAINLRM